MLETRDSGRALRESRGDVGGHANSYHWFASLADKNSGRTIPIDDSVHAFTSRVPVGVVGAITPWNVPLMAALWKLGPALASGCTVVLKPAEQTPVTSLELGKLFEQAGFPPGVVNVVPGYGKGGAGERLVTHPDVNKIAFTGEGTTAKAILRAGADTLKRFTFELGGKAPHIIFADADLEQALNAATVPRGRCAARAAPWARASWSSGQSTTRWWLNSRGAPSACGSARRCSRRPTWARRRMPSSSRRRCPISTSAAAKAPSWSPAAGV